MAGVGMLMGGVEDCFTRDVPSAIGARRARVIKLVTEAERLQAEERDILFASHKLRIIRSPRREKPSDRSADARQARTAQPLTTPLSVREHQDAQQGEGKGGQAHMLSTPKLTARGAQAGSQCPLSLGPSSRSPLTATPHGQAPPPGSFGPNTPSPYVDTPGPARLTPYQVGAFVAKCMQTSKAAARDSSDASASENPPTYRVPTLAMPSVSPQNEERVLTPRDLSESNRAERPANNPPAKPDEHVPRLRVLPSEEPSGFRSGGGEGVLRGDASNRSCSQYRGPGDGFSVLVDPVTQHDTVRKLNIRPGGLRIKEEARQEEPGEGSHLERWLHAASGGVRSSAHATGRQHSQPQQRSIGDDFWASMGFTSVESSPLSLFPASPRLERRAPEPPRFDGTTASCSATFGLWQSPPSLNGAESEMATVMRGRRGSISSGYKEDTTAQMVCMKDLGDSNGNHAVEAPGGPRPMY